MDFEEESDMKIYSIEEIKNLSAEYTEVCQTKHKIKQFIQSTYIPFKVIKI